MTSRSVFSLLLALALLPAAGPIRGQDAGTAAPEAAAAGEPAPAADAADAKQKAKEARIEDYLRRREERLSRKKAREQAARDLEAAKALEQQQLATSAPAPPPPAPAAAPSVPTATLASPAAPEEPEEMEVPRARPAEAARPSRARAATKPAAPRHRTALPRDLARAQANVRALPLGQDPTVQTYLERIDAQDASPHQLAAFGSFLAQNGLLQDALVYYDVALRLESRDPLLWINAGTLRRQLNQTGPARAAYERALALDPNSALAHYNLGAVLDDLGRYDGAMHEYKAALTLDPTLGDPTLNPQAANNDILAAVKLMLYREQIGSLGLPLVAIPADAGAAPAD